MKPTVSSALPQSLTPFPVNGCQLPALPAGSLPCEQELLKNSHALLSDWLKCPYMEESEELLKKIGQAAPLLDVKLLEAARRWAWQTVSADYNPEGVTALYRIIQTDSDIDLGPEACRFSRDLNSIRTQIKNTRAIIGPDLDKFNRGESCPLAHIERYHIMKHRHPCGYGTGLITFSLFDGERKLYQVSFFPSSPLKVFEIKGAPPAEDPAEARAIKRSVHRFKSKFGCSAASALIGAVLNTAAEIGEAVDIAAQASRWRNFGIARDQKRAAQADLQHVRVAGEIRLRFPPVEQALYEAVEDLSALLAESQADGLDLFSNLHRYGLQGWVARHSKGIIEGAYAGVSAQLSREDFFYQVVFSRYFEERNAVEGIHYKLRDTLAPLCGNLEAGRIRHGDRAFCPPPFFSLSREDCANWKSRFNLQRVGRDFSRAASIS